MSRRSRTNREGIRYELLPVTDLSEGVVGWEGQDDPEMPLNFPMWKKWLLVGLLAAITLLTPFASSILSPGISKLNAEFNNDIPIVGSMTVSIYLLGYVVGPLFLAPLSEIYGRKPILGLANIFFCVWQIGCALAPNIATLIVFRFFTGLGGAGCLVSSNTFLSLHFTDGWYRPWAAVLSATCSNRTDEDSPWVYGHLGLCLVLQLDP